MTLYVAVDIGCIECGEPSNVLGIFTNKEDAEHVANEHEQEQAQHWTRPHSFEVFEVDGIVDNQRLHKAFQILDRAGEMSNGHS